MNNSNRREKYNVSVGNNQLRSTEEKEVIVIIQVVGVIVQIIEDRKDTEIGINIRIGKNHQEEKIDIHLIIVIEVEVHLLQVEVEVEETKTEPTTDYSPENILTLKKMAKEKGIKGYYNMKKDELVKILSK